MLSMSPRFTVTSLRSRCLSIATTIECRTTSKRYFLSGLFSWRRNLFSWKIGIHGCTKEKYRSMTASRTSGGGKLADRSAKSSGSINAVSFLRRRLVEDKEDCDCSATSLARRAAVVSDVSDQCLFRRGCVCSCSRSNSSPSRIADAASLLF